MENTKNNSCKYCKGTGITNQPNGEDDVQKEYCSCIFGRLKEEDDFLNQDNYCQECGERSDCLNSQDICRDCLEDIEYAERCDDEKWSDYYADIYKGLKI